MPQRESTAEPRSPESPTAQTDCPLCQGQGWLVKNGKAYRCKCTVERGIAARLPERYRKASLEDFHGETLALIVNWLSHPTDGLFITGTVGTGKTHLAAAIVRHLIEARTDVTFRRCARFYADVRETYRTNASEETVLEPLEQTRFLVLDDLGAGSLSDHERRFTLELLERRLNKNRPTVMTSNWSLEDIAQRMDDRIASRLSLFFHIELAGEDLRVRHGN